MNRFSKDIKEKGGCDLQGLEKARRLALQPGITQQVARAAERRQAGLVTPALFECALLGDADKLFCTLEDGDDVNPVVSEAPASLLVFPDCRRVSSACVHLYGFSFVFNVKMNARSVVQFNAQDACVFRVVLETGLRTLQLSMVIWTCCGLYTKCVLSRVRRTFYWTRASLELHILKVRVGQNRLKLFEGWWRALVAARRHRKHVCARRRFGRSRGHRAFPVGAAATATGRVE